MPVRLTDERVIAGATSFHVARLIRLSLAHQISQMGADFLRELSRPKTTTSNPIPIAIPIAIGKEDNKMNLIKGLIFCRMGVA